MGKTVRTHRDGGVVPPVRVTEPLTSRPCGEYKREGTRFTRKYVEKTACPLDPERETPEGQRLSNLLRGFPASRGLARGVIGDKVREISVVIAYHIRARDIGAVVDQLRQGKID